QRPVDDMHALEGLADLDRVADEPECRGLSGTLRQRPALPVRSLALLIARHGVVLAALDTHHTVGEGAVAIKEFRWRHVPSAIPCAASRMSFRGSRTALSSVPRRRCARVSAPIS